jgi:hypothetical protein
LSYDYLDSLLSQSESAIAIFDYELVRDNYNIIKEQVDLAINTLDLINKLEKSISKAQEKSINVDEAERMLKLAKLSFSRNDYKEAYERVMDAQVSYAFSVKGQIGAISYYLMTYPKEITALLFAMAFIIFVYTRLFILKS